MSEWEIDGQEVSPKALWRVLEDFESGALSDSEREDLFRILEESHRARAVYLEYFELSALLQIKAATQQEEGTLPVLDNRFRQRRVMRFSVLAAAAVLAVLGILAAFVALKTPEPRRVPLAASEGSAWTVSGGPGDPQAVPGQVVEGSTLEVASGTVLLTLESGTRFVVQGPARVRFPRLEEPVVENGWLWTDTAGGSRELSVTTAALRFRDIGTRFGVRVRGDGKAELHVMEGIVEVFTKDNGRTSKVVPGTAGLVIAPDGSVEGTPQVSDPFPGLPALMESGPRFATVIMGQSPSGYWRLGETEVGHMTNEVAGGSTGQYAKAANPTAPGVRPAAGFNGFEDGNRGAYLPGDDVQSLLYNLDAPAGVSPREGAVAFWIRREADLAEAEVLWFAGVPEGGGLGPEEEINAYLAESGEVRFFIEAGDEDVLLTSPVSCADGRWHHVVASWGPAAAELFVDGTLVDRESGPRPAPGPPFAGSDVRFGKTGSGSATPLRDLRTFRGWVDEIALWNRPLTATEVALQFRSAKDGLPATTGN